MGVGRDSARSAFAIGSAQRRVERVVQAGAGNAAENRGDHFGCLHRQLFEVLVQVFADADFDLRDRTRCRSASRRRSTSPSRHPNPRRSATARPRCDARRTRRRAVARARPARGRTSRSAVARPARSCVRRRRRCVAVDVRTPSRSRSMSSATSGPTRRATHHGSKLVRSPSIHTTMSPRGDQQAGPQHVALAMAIAETDRAPSRSEPPSHPRSAAISADRSVLRSSTTTSSSTSLEPFHQVAANGLDTVHRSSLPRCGKECTPKPFAFPLLPTTESIEYSSAVEVAHAGHR